QVNPKSLVYGSSSSSTGPLENSSNLTYDSSIQTLYLSGLPIVPNTGATALVVNSSLSVFSDHIELMNPLSISQGGTGSRAAAFTSNGMVYVSSGGGAFVSTPGYTAGSVVIADSNGVPRPIAGAQLRAELGLAIETDVQAYSNVLDLLTATGTPNAQDMIVATATGVYARQTPSQVRANLSLGTIALQNTVGDSNWAGGPLSIGNGGTGRTNFTDTDGSVLCTVGGALVTQNLLTVGSSLAVLGVPLQVGSVVAPSGSYLGLNGYAQIYTDHAVIPHLQSTLVESQTLSVSAATADTLVLSTSLQCPVGSITTLTSTTLNAPTIYTSSLMGSSISFQSTLTGPTVTLSSSITAPAVATDAINTATSGGTLMLQSGVIEATNSAVTIQAPATFNQDVSYAKSATIDGDVTINGNLALNGGLAWNGTVIVEPTVGVASIFNATSVVVSNSKVINTLNEVLLSVVFQVTPSAANIQCTFMFSLPGMTSPLTNAYDVIACASGWTDTYVILQNLLVCGVASSDSCLLQFQAAGTDVHYIQVMVRYTAPQ
ncbi:uncharacterized protein BJ171DRAFT_617478, partial [Polychytrium aggregatum]|uniref:uncharacterized protein n=1 Tax=Polychytrium aggregatum TaxID=110093 RepID=UPI0022FF3428